MTLSDLVDPLPAIRERDARDPESYPSDSVAALYQSGIVSAPFAASLGGQGATLVESCKAIEALAIASPSMALIIAMPLGLCGFAVS